MGYGPIAHGNDLGGSLRFPAYACGAATVKPGLGRVPAYNPSAAVERGMLAQVMSVQGVICREVRDVAIFDEYYRYFKPFEGIELLKTIADRNRFIRAWTTFLADYPLVLTPFLPAPIFTWNRDEQGAEGVREVLGSALYSYAMNFMGLPAAVVPADENGGQPVGVQIVGRRFREDMILDAAEAVERAVGVMAERLWRRGS